MNETERAVARIRERLLPTVLGELDHGDFAANLLEHLRRRATPRLPFTFANLPRIAQSCGELDGREWAWNNRIADEAVGGRWYAASNPYCDRFLALDDGFDFSRIDHWDPETIHGLNRMRPLACLARRYWLDQDERYLRTLQRMWDYFAERTSEPDEALWARIHRGEPQALRPPWSELDTYIRLMNWWWAYWLSVPSPLLTPERNLVLLRRCLAAFDLVATRGVRILRHNFTSMQMEALYFWAMSLPEFSGMKQWAQNARNCQCASLRQAVYDDGVQWEASVSYHVGCIRWYASGYLLGQRNDDPWAPDVADRLRKMGRFADAAVTPDGMSLLLSDSDRQPSWREALGLLRCCFPDMKLRRPIAPSVLSLWLSDGATWNPDDPGNRLDPPPAVEVFPHGGVAVVNHPDPALGQMVAFDNGPTSAGHAHYDHLNVLYEALGQPILVDPGRWIYARDPDRDWVCHAHSHNTLYPEDQPIEHGQPIAEPMFFDVDHLARDGRLGFIESHEQAGLAILDTWHRLFRTDPAATVRRRVVMPIDGDACWLIVLDQITGTHPHVWTSSWLLPTAEPLTREDNTLTAALTDGLNVRFHVTMPGVRWTLRDQPMFWCPNYAEKEPARWLRLSAPCTSGARLWVVEPQRAGDLEAKSEITQQHVAVRLGGQTVQLPL